VNQAVVVADVDAADVAALQVRLVGDRANDVARLHAVHVADFDAEGLHRKLVAAARWTRRALAARGVVVEEHRLGGVGGRAGRIDVARGSIRASLRRLGMALFVPLHMPGSVIRAMPRSTIRTITRTIGRAALLACIALPAL